MSSRSIRPELMAEGGPNGLSGSSRARRSEYVSVFASRST